MKKEEKSVKTKKEVVKQRENYIAENKKKKKDKKHGENILKRIGRYFRGVFKEIKRIRWTSGKELIKYSIASTAFVIFFGLYFYGINWIALLIRSLAK